MDLGLRGRRAIVCGASSGLGRAIAASLVAEGADVLGTGRRPRAEVAAPAGPGRWRYVAADLADDGAPRAIVTAAQEAHGPIDIVVLSSGGPVPSTATSIVGADVEAQVRPMLTSLVDLTALVVPAMRTSGWGRIVAVGSGGIQEPIPGLVLSNVLRAGLAAYLKTLAGEVAGDGVTVNMVLPGRIDTDRVKRLDQARADAQGMALADAVAASERSIPLRRYGTPEEFAVLATFLCSDQAGYVTGEQLRVDGGVSRGY
jgi:3-oxoacyl-[acyl-carrier protein] reductase